MTLANMEPSRITPRSKTLQNQGTLVPFKVRSTRENSLCQQLEGHNDKGPRKTSLLETEESNDGILNIMGLI
eukprot:1088783-Ditylum_brightwellii.AAC.1